jgi:hypothetical protein
MYIRYSAFWLPKQGSREEEYEDAFSPPCLTEDSPAEFLCAVADGATETSFSGLWAQLLVDAYVGKGLRRLDATSVSQLADQWHAAIAEKTRAKPLPWYAEEKLKSGAYSSLLGLQIRANGRWSAVSIGDSCLFYIRPRRWLYGFPYAHADQFNNHPALLSTHADDFGSVKATLKRGTWADGDLFLLMTDALAHFFIAHPAFRKRLTDPELDQAGFARLIEAVRAEKLCRNDDVTLVRICPSAGAADRGGLA